MDKTELDGIEWSVACDPLRATKHNFVLDGPNYTKHGSTGPSQALPAGLFKRSVSKPQRFNETGIDNR